MIKKSASIKSRISNFFNLRHASYIHKWFTLSLLIGIAAGVGAIAFYWLIGEVTKLALGTGAVTPKEKWPDTKASEVMKQRLILGYDYESLHVALGKMTRNNISHLPIVDPKRPEKLSGILTVKDIALSYDHY